MSHSLDRLRYLTQERETCADGHGTVTREDAYLLYCWAGWLGGGMLTIWIMSLIFYRYTFFPLESSDPTPPYGISR